MSTVTFAGNPLRISGTLPKVGSKAPDFVLVTSTLEKVSLKNYKGSKKLLNIVPSFDTSVCAASAKAFEKKASEIIILNISRDTPFAQGRFCAAENIARSVFLSDMSHQFGKDYGVEIVGEPLTYFLARAIVVLDESDTVIYTQQVPEIKSEPDYAAALKALNLA